MNLKLSGLAVLFVLSAHCSQSPSTSSTGNTGGTSSGSNSTSGVGGGSGSGSGTVGPGSGTVAPGSGATVGGSGDTSGVSGSVAGSGDNSASGSGGGSGAGNCTLGVQGINYSGCTACGLCWQQHCCQQSNNCLNDTTCNGYLACQSNCYNGQLPDGGTFDIDAAPAPDGATLSDDCANNCLPPDAGPLWNMMQDCISPTCDTPCLCP